MLSSVHVLLLQCIHQYLRHWIIHKFFKQEKKQAVKCKLICCFPLCILTEASYTLLLYDELLEWSDRPLREFLNYPMQSEWQRKEYLHLTIIQNFDRGKVSRKAPVFPPQSSVQCICIWLYRNQNICHVMQSVTFLAHWQGRMKEVSWAQTPAGQLVPYNTAKCQWMYCASVRQQHVQFYSEVFVPS